MTYRESGGQFAVSPIKETSQEQTAQQDSGRVLDWNGIHGLLKYSSGGSETNPLAFPGWGRLYTGSYETYRWMLQHPVLQLVRSICVDPIKSSSWDYASTDSSNPIPENQKAALKANFDNIRMDLIEHLFLQARDFGWAGCENIWEYRDGIQWISEVKPLAHEPTEVLRLDTGRVVGLRNNIGLKDKPHVDLSYPYKGFLYTYGGQYGDPYGRSWLENVRATAWVMWLDAAQQLSRIGGKISGTVTIVTSPAGTFPGPLDKDGKPTQVSYQSNAITLIKAMANGAAGAWLPSIGLQPDSKGSIDAMKVLAELVGKSLTNIQVVDHSGNAAALGPILQKMQHAEELMFAGGLRSSRTGLEGSHGTKAEAGVHTDTGTVNAESEDENFAKRCQPLVDAFMTVNFGEKARGRVRIVPPSLVDRKKSTFKVLLTALLNNQYIAEEVSNTIDMNELLKTMDLPVSGKFDGQNVIKRSGEKDQKKQFGNDPVNPEGGRPAKEK